MSASRVAIYLPLHGPFSGSDFVAYATGERVQVCRPSVVRQATRISLELHLAQLAAGPTTLEELQSSAGCVPVLVLPAATDVVRAQCDLQHGALAAEVAAALGVMQAAWAWDERSVIPVELNGVRFDVGPTNQGERMWDVTVVS